jgi:hypothetical protein
MFVRFAAACLAIASVVVCMAELAFVPGCAARPPVAVAPGVRAPRDVRVDRDLEFYACPSNMAHVDGRFCIDRYEAALVEVERDGERPFSPFSPVGAARVRAISEPGIVPQAYISRTQAAAACAASGKRLCRAEEWVFACKGGALDTKFPYGDVRMPGYCNDAAPASPVRRLFAHLGTRAFTFGPMNDGRLNQLPGTLAVTGQYTDCTNQLGVYDMVGNLHEWVDEPQATFRGGYYLDTRINGDGCEYRTVAHGADYHDDSTGFRCCADAQ